MTTSRLMRIAAADADRHRALRLERLEGRWMLSADQAPLFDIDVSMADFQRHFDSPGQVSEGRNGKEQRHSDRGQSHRKDHHERDSDRREKDRSKSKRVGVDLAFASLTPPAVTIEQPVANQATGFGIPDNTLPSPPVNASNVALLISLNRRIASLPPSGSAAPAALGPALFTFEAATALPTSTGQRSANEPVLDETASQQTLVSLAPAAGGGEEDFRPTGSDFLPDVAEVLQNHSTTFGSYGPDSPTPSLPSLGLADVDRWLDDAESLRGKFEALDRALEQLSEQQREEGSIDLPPARRPQTPETPQEPNSDWLTETRNLPLSSSATFRQSTTSSSDVDEILADVADAGWTVGIGMNQTFEGLGHETRPQASSDAVTFIDIASWRLEPDDDGFGQAASVDTESSVAFYVGVAAAGLAFRQLRSRYAPAEKNWELVTSRCPGTPQ